MDISVMERDVSLSNKRPRHDFEELVTEYRFTEDADDEDEVFCGLNHDYNQTQKSIQVSTEPINSNPLTRLLTCHLTYQFLIHSIVEYLSIKDILQCLIMSNKLVKKLINGARVSMISPKNLFTLWCRMSVVPTLYPSIKITGVKDVVIIDTLGLNIPNRKRKFAETFGNDAIKYEGCRVLFEMLNNSTPGLNLSSITHFTFDEYFDQQLLSNSIPSSVTHLVFGKHYNQIISQNTIPNSVTHITFGFHFNQPLVPGCIPASVTHLTFGYEFNQSLTPGCIPSSVTHLTFGSKFNRSLTPGCIPSSVTHLNFGNWISFHHEHTTFKYSTESDLKFLHNLEHTLLVPNVIPSSITHLSFGYYFNERLSHGMIPSSVTHLHFGQCFNQQLLPDTLPSSITNLTFGDSFNQPLLPNSLPESIKHLTFGYNFRQKINSIPSSVKYLTFDQGFFDHVYPDTFFIWSNQMKRLIPTSLTQLRIGGKLFDTMRVVRNKNVLLQAHNTNNEHFDE